MPDLRLRRPAEPLTDGVVVLDEFCRADVDDLVQVIDEEILRWLPLPDPYGETEAREFVEARANTDAVGDALNFAIRMVGVGDGRDAGRVAGSIGVSVSRPRTGEVQVGYWVAPHARGRGIAHRAVVLLARHALATPGVERLEVLTHPANEASRRVAERAGARFEGIRRGGLVPPAPDGTTDTAVYALIPADLRGEDGLHRS